MKEKEIGKLAVEYWKLIRSYERSLPLLPATHHAKTQAQIRYSANRLEAILSQLQIVLQTYEGKIFEPNLPVTAVNAEDFDSENKTLIIDQTIEPAIIFETNVLAMGKVILKKE